MFLDEIWKLVNYVNYYHVLIIYLLIDSESSIQKALQELEMRNEVKLYVMSRKYAMSAFAEDKWLDL